MDNCSTHYLNLMRLISVVCGWDKSTNCKLIAIQQPWFMEIRHSPQWFMSPLTVVYENESITQHMPSSLCGLQEITLKAINLEHLATCFAIFINHSEAIVYNTDITCCFHNYCNMLFVLGHPYNMHFCTQAVQLCNHNSGLPRI